MNLVNFNFEDMNIRVLNIDGKAWFVAIDVCRCLGYSKPRNAVKRHCKQNNHALKRSPLNTDGGKQIHTLIDEANLYRLVLKSKMPFAVAFSDYVFEVILPTIRRTGKFSLLDNPPAPLLAVDIVLENAKELNKTFSDAWFAVICKMRGWAFDRSKNTPSAMAWIINTQVYDRLSKDVLEWLRQINPFDKKAGKRPNFHHQHIKDEKGIPELQELLSLQIHLAEIAGYDWNIFLLLLDRHQKYTRKGHTLRIPFPLGFLEEQKKATPEG